jgi:hypothetical protein
VRKCKRFVPRQIMPGYELRAGMGGPGAMLR